MHKIRIPIFFVLLGVLSGFAPNKNEEMFSLFDQASQVKNGLYFSRCEVSNEEYKTFLLGLIEEGRADLVPQYAPDLEVWNELEFVNPYVKYYFAHPAFDHYPVVGVSHEAAVAFCEWKTRAWGERVALKKRIDSQKYRFRLPTESEWMEAANPHSKDPAYFAGGYAYPRNHKGQFMFNHKLGQGNYAGVLDGNPKDYEGYMVTAPVRSFLQDDHGLFNICGNVAEMVAESGTAKGGSWYHEASECRISTDLEYDKPSSWLGFRYVLEPVQ